MFPGVSSLKEGASHPPAALRRVLAVTINPVKKTKKTSLLQVEPPPQGVEQSVRQVCHKTQRRRATNADGVSQRCSNPALRVYVNASGRVYFFAFIFLELLWLSMLNGTEEETTDFNQA